ncbi:MAG: oligosaccharide flippase family protein [Caldilineaceae bacterium]
MHRLRTYRADLAACAFLLLLALLWFAPVLAPILTGKSLLPYDNLYTFEPYRSLHPGILPHNNLLSDLVLENAVWKLHILRTWGEGELLPLWNPQIFTGIPFLAAGQASTFYPLSILFYILPLEAAYGWFTALQVALAGINLYIFARVLKIRRPAALFSGVVFMFSGFLIVSVVFTMFMAAMAWLPLLLAIIELIIQRQEEKGAVAFNPTPYLAVGVAVLALVMLAGHPELIYYTLLVAGAYTLFRLIVAWRRVKIVECGINNNTIRNPQSSIRNSRSAFRIFQLAAWLLVMVVLGVAAGGAQLIPLVELLPLNFRVGSASLQQIRDWAWPLRHVVSFILPNVFGNPSHHQWFDLWNWQWVPATVNAHGQPNYTIDWGIKNYVEGGNYLGIATWVLTGISIADWWRKDRNLQFAIRNLYILFFACLALLSLLFAFGTPLYALLFYGLPGWNQLHSPFRWVFPFTLSMAVLAGFGLDQILKTGRQEDKERGEEGGLQNGASHNPQFSFRIPYSVLLISMLTTLAGLAILAVLALSKFYPAPFVAFAQRIVDGSDLAQNAFADGRMFWGYQAGNLLHFGLVAVGSGLLIGIISYAYKEIGRWGDKGSRKLLTSLSPYLLIAFAALDLYAAHGRFNPSSDVSLSPLRPENIPPVVKFINEREGIDLAIRNSQSATQNPQFRFTTFQATDEQTFWANVGMYYGWQDLRGYDSVIPRQYAQLMEQIQPQAEHGLLYNRIAPLRGDLSAQATGDPYAVLNNPLLDLLNVKYVLTERYLPNPTWKEIYRDPSIAVYENQEVLPRTFIVPQVEQSSNFPISNLQSLDFRKTALIEQPPADPAALTPSSPQLREAQISRATANEVFVDVNLSDRGWLVLADAWFPGWKAYIRPFGAGENEEEETPIYRADGALRAVYIPKDGQWTVRFIYTPMSYKLGLYVSFLALMSTILLGGYWAWGRFYRPVGEAGDVHLVAKNTLIPTILSLTNKVLDFAYAAMYVRLLGKEGTGQWYFVVAIYGVFEIVSRYGLGTLLTRDVAEDKGRSSRYLTNVTILRTLFWLISMPILMAVIWVYWVIGGTDFKLALGPFTLIDAQNIQGIGMLEIQAIALLSLSMLFSNWADGLSNCFNAFEKMEYPAGLSTAANMVKVTLGMLVLLLGWSFVGLALVSVIVNLFGLLLLWMELRRTLFKPQWQPDRSLQRWMFANSGALMINHLLATIFWRIDVWILRPLAGAMSVGLYSVGLKYLDGLNIIPSLFTMAVFPLMSRYAKREGGDLLRAYVLCLRLLVIVGLPLAMTVTFLARPMISVVGGSEFLDIPETWNLFGRSFHLIGGGDLALRVIIWSIPIGFVNSVTQYALISVNQQRYLTRAFIIGVVFNVVGNLLLIPRFGYVAAAFTTIFSEFSLLFPFYYSVRRNIGPVPWFTIFVPPLLAVLLMGAACYGLIVLGVNLWLAVLLSEFVYLVGLVLTGSFKGEEMAIVGKALPLGRLRKFVSPTPGV